MIHKTVAYLMNSRTALCMSPSTYQTMTRPRYEKTIGEVQPSRTRCTGPLIFCIKKFVNMLKIIVDVSYSTHLKIFFHMNGHLSIDVFNILRDCRRIWDWRVRTKHSLKSSSVTILNDQKCLAQNRAMIAQCAMGLY